MLIKCRQSRDKERHDASENCNKLALLVALVVCKRCNHFLLCGTLHLFAIKLSIMILFWGGKSQVCTGSECCQPVFLCADAPASDPRLIILPLAAQ